MKRILAFGLIVLSLSLYAASFTTDKLCLAEGVDKVCIVSGSISTDINYTLPVDDGVDTQVLTTDGAGVLTWEDSGATPVVAARYSTNAGQNINMAAEIVDFEDVDYDTDSAVTTGASWHFEAPRDGYYTVCSAAHFTGTTEYDIGEQFFLFIYVEGVEHSIINFYEMKTSPASNVIIGGGGCDTVFLSATDEVNVRITQSSLAAGGLDLTSNNSLVWISITEQK